MSNKLLILLLAGALSLLGSTGKANDDQELCGFYGNIGRSIAEFMLPLTIQQMVDMNSGNNPALQKEMEAKVMTYVTANQLIAAGNLKEQEITFFAESAGQNGVMLLMEAKARSSTEVYDILETRCKRVGALKLIENQIEVGKLIRGEK
ncbi:MAG: hypothetical protein JKY46_09670 [Robiginitomaculum sp.]|nr:hypothetical protein [Robiginitomaculum sp.]